MSDRRPLLEDFALGQELACGPPRALTPGDASLYLALTGDPGPRWCDGSERVHPLVLFHTVFGQTVRSVSLNARANLGYAEMIWHREARLGAVIRTRATVVGLKENRSGADGIVWVRTEGRDEAGPLLSFVRWVMVPKRDPELRTPWFAGPVRPELAAEVDPEDCSPPPGAGGATPQVGARLVHPGACTVTDAEHRLFTRLFHNPARVHFDETLRRPSLAYGGYVWSIGWALSAEDLGVRRGLAAVNGGRHALPVVAGDVLFACTDILEVRAGAVRCRLLVTRNAPPDPAPGSVDPETVCLDLDCWAWT